MTKDIGYSEGKSSLEVQDEIVEDFSSMGDPFDQFTYLLQLASELEELPEEQKTKASLIAGCQ